MAVVRVLYFGCQGRGNRGHSLYGPRGPLLRRGAEAIPFTDAELDGGFCPEGAQGEGLARLHCLRGWTVLAFWDRSADHRGNSHSTFLAEGNHDFHEMVGLVKETFPTIWKRWRFSLHLCRGPLLPPDATEIG